MNFRKRIRQYFETSNEKFILWTISLLGFATAASCEGTAQPEYGVKPLYGVPVNRISLQIKGNIKSAKTNLPVSKIKITSSGDIGNFETLTDSKGNYVLNHILFQYESSVKLNLSDADANDGIDYISKDSTLKVGDLELNPVVNFIINENKK